MAKASLFSLLVPIKMPGTLLVEGCLIEHAGTAHMFTGSGQHYYRLDGGTYGSGKNFSVRKKKS
jgi:hypothetical protein